MKVLGLITEHNPFHNGHLHHLQASKEISGASHTISIMSGNFLQRGEAALMNKWARAKAAINNGVDLVIELPFAFACRSAQSFAYGSIALLHNCGIVNHVCFGSELGNIKLLSKVAQIVLNEPEDYKIYLKRELKRGLVFPLAREKALNEYLSQNPMDNYSTKDLEKILSSPNNILGVEYIRSLLLLKSNITPMTITRKVAGYHDLIKEEENTIASATGIREKIKESMENNIPLEETISSLRKYYPSGTLDVLKEEFLLNQFPVWTESTTLPLLWLLRSSMAEDLAKIHDISEGLENRIIEGAKVTSSYSELLDFLKTKRYTMTRLKRILLYTLTKYTKDLAIEFDKIGPQYIRILGFNEKGQQLLELMKENATLPLITLGKDYKKLDFSGQKMFKLDVQGTDLYTLLYPNLSRSQGSKDFYEKPVIIK